MKKPNGILLFILISSSLPMAAQSDPVKIDLKNNGVKLDARFYSANKAI